MVVNIVLFIAFSIILMYDIHESYGEVSIQNTSTAVSERRVVNEYSKKTKRSKKTKKGETII